MAGNGNGIGDDLGALRERVRNYGEDLHDLKAELNNSHRALSAQIKAVADQLSQKSQPQYPLLVSIFSVAIAFVSVIGYLAYSPIQRDTSRLETAVLGMPDRYVNSRQYEMRTGDLNEQLQTVRRTFLRRDDFDVQHKDLKDFLNAQIANLQRQMETLQKRLDDIWTTRDAIVDMRQRMDKLERGKP